MPMVGLGTWLISNDEVSRVVTDALDLGYKHIDTAQIYQNESGIGEAISKASIDRDKFFITTKMWPGMVGDETFQDFKGALNACDQSLQMLQSDYIDLYLIHNPFGKDHRLEQWEALVELQKQGKVKDIGVSNYNVKHIKEIEHANLPMPVANQIEIHPYHMIPDALQSYMMKHNILPIAYSTLAPLPNWRKDSRWNSKPEAMKNDPSIPFLEVAKKYNISVAQLLLKWSLQNGWPILPKTTSKERLKENLDLDFTISSEDMNHISTSNKDQSLAWQEKFDPLDVK
jgi:2,5-diketo-D-gluconate reductase A